MVWSQQGVRPADQVQTGQLAWAVEGTAENLHADSIVCEWRGILVLKTEQRSNALLGGCQPAWIKEITGNFLSITGRLTNHGMIDRKLALIPRCADVDDVIASVNWGARKIS